MSNYPQQRILQLDDAATISWRTATYPVATVTIAGNRTMAPAVPPQGVTLILFVKQGAGGSHLLTWSSSVKWPAATAPTLSTAAAAVDIITFVSDGTYLYGAGQLGFA